MEKKGEGSNGVILREGGRVFKVFKKHLHDSYGIDPCILREMAIGMAMNHPNVMRFTDVSMKADGSYMAEMPYYEFSLATRKIGCNDTLMKLLRQLMSGLTYIHSRGLLHRDIKPSNVLYNVDNKLVITDFGLARPTPSRYDPPTPRVGTGHYRAPEIMEDRYYSSPVDIYAAGLTLLEMLARKSYPTWAEEERKPAIMVSVLAEAVPNIDTFDRLLPAL